MEIKYEARLVLMNVRYQDPAAQSTNELFTALLVGVDTTFSAGFPHLRLN